MPERAICTNCSLKMPPGAGLLVEAQHKRSGVRERLLLCMRCRQPSSSVWLKWHRPQVRAEAVRR